MLAYIVRRLLLIVPTLLGIMVINFAIVQLAPGGPIEQIIAEISGTDAGTTGRISGGGRKYRAGLRRRAVPTPPTAAIVERRALIRTLSRSLKNSSGSTSRCTNDF